MPEPEDVPVDTGYADAYLANARSQADETEAAEGPGLGSQVLGGIGWTLGLLARPAQTGLHGLLTGNSREMGQAFDSILDASKAKDFSDIRKDVLNIRPDADEKTWFGNGVGNFATKLGVGALDLAGNVVTDPLTLVNPLNMTKAGAALRSVQEGAQAELLAGGKNILKKQAARQGMEVSEYAAKKEAEILQGLTQDIEKQAIEKGLTAPDVAKQLAAAQMDAARYAQEVAPHLELAAETNAQLGILAKQHGVQPKFVPTWEPPIGTFEEVQQSFSAYKTDLKNAINEMMPKRLGDQVNQGYRSLVGVGNPMAEATGGFNLGLKNPGAVLNKVADLKDGVVQTMEATTVGRAVIDTKRFIADTILNPAGRGAHAMLERLTQSTGDAFAAKAAPEIQGIMDDLVKAGHTQDQNGLVSEYMTLYGTKEPAQMARTAEIEAELFKGKTIEQRKAMADAMARSKKLSVESLAAQNLAGVQKDAIGDGLKQIVETVRAKVIREENQLVERDTAARQLNHAKRQLDEAEGQYVGEHMALKQKEVDDLALKELESRNHNVGVKGQRALERSIKTRPEVVTLQAEIDALKAARETAPTEKAALEMQFAGEGAASGPVKSIKQINAEIAAKQAELKAQTALSESAIQATRHLAEASGNAVGFYRAGGVSPADALALGKNRITAKGIDAAGLPVTVHAADPVHALRKGLSHADDAALQDGLREAGTPLYGHGMWTRAAGIEGDPMSLTMAAKAEANLQQHFDLYLKTGQTPVKDWAAPFAKMKAMLDVQAEHAVSGKPIKALQEKAIERAPRVAPKFPAPKGLGDAVVMKLDEFAEAGLKESKFAGDVKEAIKNDPILKQKFADAQARLIEFQISTGGSVPRAVLESHAEFSAQLRKGTPLWNQNETNWKRGLSLHENVSSIKAYNQLKSNLVKAEKTLEKFNDVPSQAVVTSLKEQLALFEQSAKEIPNYVLNALSDDATRKLVGSKQVALARMHFGEIERMFTDLGRPLSHSEVNSLIAGKPHTITAVSAVAAELPEKGFKVRELFTKDAKGQMPVTSLFGLWRPGENDFKELAKMASKVEGKTVTVDMARKMPVSQRVKYYQQAFGKFFEERPEVVTALAIDEGAKAIKSATYINGIKELFAEPIPFRKLTEEQTAQRAANMDRYRTLMKSATTSDEKAALREMRKALNKEFDQLEYKPGYVDAELLHPTLKGQMVKRDVFEQALKYMDGMKDPTWMKGMMQHMATTNSWWKAFQLAVPGAAIRDWMGNVMLRFQNDGFHSQTLKDSGKLMKLMASGGDAEKLKGLVFDFPGGAGQLGVGKMTGQELYDHVLQQGTLGHGQAREVMEQSMKGLAEQGNLYNKAVRARNWSMQTANVPQEFERLSMLHSRLMKGDTVAAAAASVDAALYNYARVSPFVNFTRKTGLIPFATWSSKNIPAQLELMVKHPGQFAAIMHAKNAIEGQNGIEGVSAENVPEYVRDKWNLVTQRDPETGDINFVTATGLIPMADLSNVEHPAAFFGDLLGPLPKVGFESLFNVNLFNKKELERFDGELTPLFKDDPDGFLVSKTKANAFNGLVGRPAAMVNDLLGVYNDSKDKQGQDKTFWDRTALLSAGTGVYPKTYKGGQQMVDRKREAEDLNRNIGIAQKALQQAQSRGSDRSAAAYQQQLYKLQEERAKMMSRR